MLKVELRGARELKTMLQDLRATQAPYAYARALNATAQDARAAIQDDIRRAFDRPTKYAVNSLFVQNAKKTNLQSRVAIKDRVARGTPPINFLRHHVTGGERVTRPFAKRLQRAGKMPRGKQAVPGKGAKLNQYGNQTRAAIVKATSTADQPGSKFFTLRRNGEPVGIFERQRRGLREVIAFARPGQYRTRLHFHQTGIDEGRRVFPRHFAEWYRRALQTAKRR